MDKISSIVQEVDPESEGSMEEEENDDNFEASTTYSSGSSTVGAKKRFLVGNVQSFSMETLF